MAPLTCPIVCVCFAVFCPRPPAPLFLSGEIAPALSAIRWPAAWLSADPVPDAAASLVLVAGDAPHSIPLAVVDANANAVPCTAAALARTVLNASTSLGAALVCSGGEGVSMWTLRFREPVTVGSARVEVRVGGIDLAGSPAVLQFIVGLRARGPCPYPTHRARIH